MDARTFRNIIRNIDDSTTDYQFVEIIRSLITRPEEPLAIYNPNCIPRLNYRCPTCYQNIGTTSNWRCNYCSQCGQMFDWSNFEPVNNDDWRIQDYMHSKDKYIDVSTHRHRMPDNIETGNQED